MSFTIYVKAPYEEIHAFYDYEGWDEVPEGWEADEDLIKRQQFIQRCIDADPEDEEEMEELWDAVTDTDDELVSGEGHPVVFGCDATIEVDDEEIENPFTDYEKYSGHPVIDVIPEVIKNSKFCFVKVWENSGEWQYKGEGTFDLTKLTCKTGELLYDGEEFEFIGSDGSSSYLEFYKDGVES